MCVIRKISRLFPLGAAFKRVILAKMTQNKTLI